MTLVELSAKMPGSLFRADLSVDGRKLCACARSGPGSEPVFCGQAYGSKTVDRFTCIQKRDRRAGHGCDRRSPARKPITGIVSRHGISSSSDRAEMAGVTGLRSRT